MTRMECASFLILMKEVSLIETLTMINFIDRINKINHKIGGDSYEKTNETNNDDEPVSGNTDVNSDTTYILCE